MQLNRTIGVSPATDPATSGLVGLFTKQPVLATLDASDVGMTATYFARWVTRTGKFGPWSLPQSMTIAFGGGAGAVTGGGTTQTEEFKIAA